MSYYLQHDFKAKNSLPLQYIHGRCDKYLKT